jgi:hypothetical protein
MSRQGSKACRWHSPIPRALMVCGHLSVVVHARVTEEQAAQHAEGHMD